MSRLEIRYLTGDVETRELSKKQPVSIGRHESNDICVDDDDVAVMHCRISWNKQGYEVVAANLEGVEVNGTLVRRAVLGPNDVLRVGSVDLFLHCDEAASAAKSLSTEKQADDLKHLVEGGGGSVATKPLSDLELVPITQDEIVLPPRPAGGMAERLIEESGKGRGDSSSRDSSGKSVNSQPKKEARMKDNGGGKEKKPTGPQSASARSKGKSKGEPADTEQNEQESPVLDAIFEDLDEDQVDYDDLFEEDAEEEEFTAKPMLSRSGSLVPPREDAAEGKRGATGKADGTRADGTRSVPATLERGEEGEEAEKRRGESVVAKLKGKIGGRPVRPGEHDILQSPLVIFLGGGSLVLLLVAFTFYFIIGRETAQRQYDAAVGELGQGKYAQSIQLFEGFLEKYPQHKYTDMALIGLGRAKIEKEISGATPNFKAGLEAVNEFIKQNQDRPAFKDQHVHLRKYGRDIALGAAKTAESAKQRDLLAVSEEASRRILERYSPADDPPAELLKQVRALLETAESAIIKHEHFGTTYDEIETAIAQKQTVAALNARRKLLERYPIFANDRKLASLLAKILETEKSLVAREDVEDRQALKQEPPSDGLPRPLSLTLHSRSRTEETSAGQTVFSVAKDCCYGIDTVTGEPVWRRVIGLDTPFFPITVNTTVPGLLLFDTNRRELVLVDRGSGQLVWRQPIDEDLHGPPLVHEGQVYLPTSANHLYKIDLDSGRITTRLTFSQKLLSPPVLIGDGDGLAVAGDQVMLYGLTLRPLACESITNLGHKPGSVVAPLVKMGRLILMAENDRLDSCLLRVLDGRDRSKGVPQVTQYRIDGGQVRDVPILRGKQLFVPISDGRIAAFSVSDDPNQRLLTWAANSQPVASQFADGAMYLAAGPDGQLWMASDALRKFELKTDSFKLDPAQTAVGLSTQPLQMVGQRLFIGRRAPYSGAVSFTQADRDQMTSLWKIVLGSSAAAWTVNGTESVVVVTESGELFYVAANELAEGGFKKNSLADLKLPDDLATPLRAVSLAQGEMAANSADGTRSVPATLGRIAVHSGEPQPTMWIVNRLGQVERQFKLDEPLEADPVEIAAGIVLPLPGRLKLVGKSSGGAPVEELLSPVAKERNIRWVHLAAMEENQFVVVDSLGKLSRVQLRSTPVPHLAEASKLQLEQPLDVPFAVHQGRIALADAAGRLQLLDAANMELRSTAELPAPASNALWVVGDKLYVETGRDRLHCFEIEPELKSLWSLALEGVSLAGEPLLAGGPLGGANSNPSYLIIAKQNGEVCALDPNEGTVVRRVHTHQPFSHGPRQLGDSIVIPSIDGSLHRVESVLQTPPKEGAEP